eukprot:TRINITY_DN36124_c0_g2_i2.p1 TRINITY_DN36124_c0_g2~~TRINITY_DN36124_c0_g2_i2.p1  ORF type:complete len:258 (+),score=75.98 TRINITY_DN36124_c0_g2_i2:158-931(+)
MLRSLVGSEMCIRDRVSTQSTGNRQRLDMAHQSILGSYGATSQEVLDLLASDPRLAEIGRTLDSERRSNAKQTDEKNTVQRNLKMVHKLLVNERDALQKILEAARQSIREAKKKQSAAESELSELKYNVMTEREAWASQQREYLSKIEDLEADNEDVRRRASHYAQMLLRHKGRLVFNMLRGSTTSALTMFFHVWKDFVQDMQTMQAAQELHEMTQGVGGHESASPGDDFEMQPEFTDLNIEAWDIKKLAGQFGLTS